MIFVRDLRSHHVAAMGKVLTATDPLEQLFVHVVRRYPFETVSSSALCVQRMITASRFSLFDPSTGKRSKWISTTPLCGLRVLGRRRCDWTTVLLPGWGQAWVHTGDVSAADLRVAPAPLIRSIPSLKLTAISPGSSQATLELLKVVGRTTRRLELIGFQYRLATDDWFRQLLQTSPVLLELVVRDQYSSVAATEFFLDSLQVFLDGYASGTSRVESLALSCTLQDVEDTLVNFFDAMSDSNHAVSKYLRELVCYVPLEQTQVGQRIFVAAQRMLQQNKTLLRLKLKFDVDNVNWKLLRRCVAPICLLDGTLVTGHCSPQQRHRNVAFLSVVAHTATAARRGIEDDGHQHHALAKIDATTAPLIFAFLTTTETRSVEVVVNKMEMDPLGQWRPLVGNPYIFP